MSKTIIGGKIKNPTSKRMRQIGVGVSDQKLKSKHGSKWTLNFAFLKRFRFETNPKAKITFWFRLKFGNEPNRII